MYGEVARQRMSNKRFWRTRMGFKIIGDRDKDGNFIASADYWTDARIDTLLKKYNPKGKLTLSKANQEKHDEKKTE